MPAYAEEQVAALQASLARLAKAANGVSAANVNRSGSSRRAQKLSAALLSTNAAESRRQSTQMTTTLKPQLDQVELRMVAKITEAASALRFGAEPEPEPEPEQEQEPGPSRSRAPSKFAGGLERSAASPQQEIMAADQLGERINPFDPMWVPRTVYIGGIDEWEATPAQVKEGVHKVAAAQARAVKDGGLHAPGVMVSVSVRRKPEQPDGSWALVSFSTEEGARRLLEEQERTVGHRITGKPWIFLAFSPDRLTSYEARRSLFQSKWDASDWNQHGMVGQVAKKFIEQHKSTEDERTVWVGNVPDRIGRENFEGNLCELFEVYGAVTNVQVRYKAQSLADGCSWGLVTFRKISSVGSAMNQKIEIQEELDHPTVPSGTAARCTRPR